jgi:pyruvate ferredoxin oxidoreductase beta subunit
MKEEVELLAPGHRMCSGCGVALAARIAVNAAGRNTIVVFPTGCMEVTTTQYPETAWRIPAIHVAFENAAAVASGIDSALKMQGKREGKNIVAIAGDGGTFDIGIQALSGMFERGHKVTFICNDNEAYMNTGIQRCSATPYGAWTTTSPPGKYSIGESRVKKPLARIAAAHCIPYVATATVAYVPDYQKKVRKALSANGPSLIHVLAPCPTGWRFPPEKMVELSRLAVQTGVFPLWEVENGEMENLKVTVKIQKRKPVAEYLKVQGRFRHLFKPVLQKDVIDKIQADIDKKFERVGL